jgi:hypothetical protein
MPRTGPFVKPGAIPLISTYKGFLIYRRAAEIWLVTRAWLLHYFASAVGA